MDRFALHIAAERGHTSAVEILTEKFRSCVLARTKVIRFQIISYYLKSQLSLNLIGKQTQMSQSS